MRLTHLISVLVVAFSANAWNLRSPIPALTSLGYLQQSTTLENVFLYTHSTGCRHIQTKFNTFTSPIDVFDICVTSNKSVHFTIGGSGRAADYSTTPLTNGLVFTGTGDPGIYVTYDPHIGIVTTNGTPSGRDGYFSRLGTDNNLYIADYLYGETDWYDVPSSTLHKLGKVDSSAPIGTYCYRLCSDGTYIYTVQRNASYYLGIIAKDGSSTNLYWKSDDDTYGNIEKEKTGTRYYYTRTLSNSSKKYYLLHDGAPEEVASTPTLEEYYRASGGNVEPTTFSTQENITVDAVGIYPSASNNISTIGYMTNGVGSFIYQSATNFQLVPSQTKRILATSGNRMIVVGETYVPVLYLTNRASSAYPLGPMPFSIYDVVAVGTNIAFTGYTAVSLKFDESKPWTLNDFVAATGTNINPHKVPGGWGQYHYYAAGVGNTLYVGCQYVRDSTGLVVGWQNFDDRTYGSTNLPDYDIRDLKTIDGGDNLIVATDSGTNFIFNTSTKTITRSIPIFSPLTNMDNKVAVVGEYGMSISGTNLVGFRSDGTVVYTNTLPYESWSTTSFPHYDHRVSIGPDSMAWITCGTNLVRVDVRTGNSSVVCTVPKPCNVAWSGGDAYLYEGANNNVYALYGLLTNNVSCEASGKSILLGKGHFQ